MKTIADNSTCIHKISLYEDCVKCNKYFQVAKCENITFVHLPMYIVTFDGLTLEYGHLGL